MQKVLPRVLCVLVALILGGGTAWGEVLIQNQNYIAPGTKLATGTKAKFTLNFTVNNSTTVGGIAFFSDAATADSNLDFILLKNGVSVATNTNLAAQGAANTLGGGYAYMTYFNFTGALSTTVITGGSDTWQLNVGGNGGNGLNGAYYYTTNNSLQTSSNINSATQNANTYNGGGAPAGSTYLNFSLLNTAVSPVPEPGTLLLGGLAALSGGAGVWWKRRKKKSGEQTEEIEGKPSV